MKIIYRNLIALLVFCSLLFVFGGCNKVEFVGNSLCESADFKITQTFSLSANTVDPALNKLNISAVFSEPVSWSLTVVGERSHAQKTFEGKSASVNIDFYGNSENDHFFSAEKCVVKLTVGCAAAEHVLFFNYSTKPFFKKANFGALVGDFDGHGAFSTGGGWFDGAKLDVQLLSNIVSDPSPQGGKALLYHGVVKDSLAAPANNIWYFGGCKSPLLSVVSALSNAGFTNTDSLYLNMYVRGYGDEFPNSQMQLTLDGQPYASDNGNVPEAKIYALNIDWEGWRMVSVKLSDFKGLHRFTSIVGINSLGIGLAAGPVQTFKSKFMLDFMIITANAPYKEVR
jgi:hypothetical protein